MYSSRAPAFFVTHSKRNMHDRVSTALTLLSKPCEPQPQRWFGFLKNVTSFQLWDVFCFQLWDQKSISGRSASSFALTSPIKSKFEEKWCILFLFLRKHYQLGYSETDQIHH